MCQKEESIRLQMLEKKGCCIQCIRNYLELRRVLIVRECCECSQIKYSGTKYRLKYQDHSLDFYKDFQTKRRQVQRAPNWLLIWCMLCCSILARHIRRGSCEEGTDQCRSFRLKPSRENICKRQILGALRIRIWFFHVRGSRCSRIDTGDVQYGGDKAEDAYFVAVYAHSLHELESSFSSGFHAKLEGYMELNSSLISRLIMVICRKERT